MKTREDEMERGKYITLNHRYRLNLTTLKRNVSKILAWGLLTWIVASLVGVVLFGSWALYAIMNA